MQVCVRSSGGIIGEEGRFVGRLIVSGMVVMRGGRGRFRATIVVVPAIGSPPRGSCGVVDKAPIALRRAVMSK